MKVLVAGAGGQLGRALIESAPTGMRVIGLDRSALDIRDSARVAESLVQHQPDAVINAAAYTAVDKAESAPELADDINHLGAAHLATACADAGARLIHVSTDFVFNGRANQPYAADAATDPLGVYGRSKLAGELAVRAAHPEATIVRTAWVYGPVGHNFLLTMLRLLRERDQLNVVYDQIGTPSCTHGIASALYTLLESGQGRGETLHWTDAGVASWYDFSCAIRAHGQQLQPEARWAKICPIRTADYPTPAQRPAYSVLEPAWPTGVGPARRHWQDELEGVISNFLCSEGDPS